LNPAARVSGNRYLGAAVCDRAYRFESEVPAVEFDGGRYRRPQFGFCPGANGGPDSITIVS
jgi:hypothetical protein